MILYAIREKGTNKYLPNGLFSYGRLRPRGFSHAEPSNTLQPRLFCNLRSVNNALSTWLAGKWSEEFEYRSGEDISLLSVEKISGRKRENMEVVKFKLVEIKK